MDSTYIREGALIDLVDRDWILGLILIWLLNRKYFIIAVYSPLGKTDLSYKLKF